MSNTTETLVRVELPLPGEHTFEARHLMEVVSENTSVKSDCTAISFLNIGDVDAKVIEAPIAAGDPMLSFEGDPDTVDRTIYKILFDGETTGTNPRVLIIRRYINRIKKQANR
jgi:hypothetical protein